MKRISILSAALGLGSMLAQGFGGAPIVSVERDRPLSHKRKRIAKHKQAVGRSRYMPHIGAKEQKRARRCYMRDGILQQMSKREYDLHCEAELIARAG